MQKHLSRIQLSSFASEFGDIERNPESIEGFARIWASHGLTLSPAAMGWKAFWQMTGPIEAYVARCIGKTIASSGTPPEAVHHVIFATMDKHIRHLHPDFARRVLEAAGLTDCIPTLISLQQCASSLAAVNYAQRLLAEDPETHIIIAAFDYVPDDRDRVMPFALFGDAATSCMVSRDAAAGLALLGYGANVDFAGIRGRDDFQSRQRVVFRTLEKLQKQSGVRIQEIERCFSTNVHKPIAFFNAGMCGISRDQLSIDTLPLRAHCGNCDWMMNLCHHQETRGFKAGSEYLAQSFSPGLFACVFLEACERTTLPAEAPQGSSGA